jgi:hypothetical protein
MSFDKLRTSGNCAWPFHLVFLFSAQPELVEGLALTFDTDARPG